MIAAPNGISQGSNGTGGGALTAFRGISAAKTGPAIASTMAVKAIFFIKIPIQRSVRIRRPKDRAAAKYVNQRGNLVGAAWRMKQKI
jgi:hypothetical protein